MAHDPEQLAAAYLEGLHSRARRRYEQHLLGCEPCWSEVSLARAGRRHAESIRDQAPASLRDDIRAAVAALAAEPPTATRAPRRALILTAAAVLLILTSAAVAWRHSEQPTHTAAPATTLTAAVAGFRANQLPGVSIPVGRAPDLSALELQLVGAAAGQVDGVQVTAYAYRTDAGARLYVYRSAREIPETDQAEGLGDNRQAWQSQISGITVICGPASHTTLVLGSDAVLVRRASELLAIT